jgi:hypothetical protein
MARADRGRVPHIGGDAEPVEHFHEMIAAGLPVAGSAGSI